MIHCADCALAAARRAARSGQHARALAACQSALEVPATQAEALHELGVLAAELGDPETGRALLAEALEMAPQDLELRRRLGLVLEQLGDDAGAEAAYRRVLVADPDSEAALASLGGLPDAQGRLEGAARFAEHVELASVKPSGVAHGARVDVDDGGVGVAICCHGDLSPARFIGSLEGELDQRAQSTRSALCVHRGQVGSGIGDEAARRLQQEEAAAPAHE